MIEALGKLARSTCMIKAPGNLARSLHYAAIEEVQRRSHWYHTLTSTQQPAIVVADLLGSTLIYQTLGDKLGYVTRHAWPSIFALQVMYIFVLSNVQPIWSCGTLKESPPRMPNEHIVPLNS